MQPLQRLWSSGLRRMIDRIASITSFGQSTSLLNAFLHRKEESSFVKTTVADTLWQDGEAKEANDAAFTAQVFEKTEWLTDNGVVKKDAQIPDAIVHPIYPTDGVTLIEEMREKVIEAYNNGRIDEAQIKDKRLIDMIGVCPEHTVIVMADSIVCPHQKEHRNVNGVTGMVRSRKCVSIANAYILSKEGVYKFTSSKEESVIKRALAYLIFHNMLANRELIFFADGAKSLRDLVKKYFGFRPYYYYLDWYHLRKKCYEYFTMALYGGKANRERNEKIRYGFFKILWAGNVDDAIAYLDAIDKKAIKSPAFIDAVKDYIGNKKRDSIYSYALRKELGLVNSSNLDEKLNDQSTGIRCKGNAMSWSDDGSEEMAQIRMIFLDEEDSLEDKEGSGSWFQTHNCQYKPVPLTETMQARMFG